MEVKVEEDPSYVGAIATTFGTTGPAICLVISLFLGYLSALVYRHLLRDKHPRLQHLFFIASGLGIGYFNFGTGVLHSAATLTGVYLILCTLGGTSLSVACVFASTMAYLMFGYYAMESDEYDIMWTTPQCVVTLKLIGTAFDLHDGARPPEELSEERSKSVLRAVPTFLELAGYIYFPPTFLVGPHFPFATFKSFVSKTLLPDPETPPKSLSASLVRGGVGCLYLGAYQMLDVYLPDMYLVSDQHDASPFLRKCLVLCVWGKKVLCKYVGCWMMAESACIATGVSYNGVDVDGRERWDGCSNVDLYVLERATRFEHYVASFNTKTNKWVAQNIYKRFKFLGNPRISQMFALLFLASWHGFHSGYYTCFSLEFLLINFEKDVEVMLHKNHKLATFLQRPATRPIVWGVKKTYLLLFMGYSMVPFTLLTFSRWYKVFKGVYFVGHVLLLPWPLYRPLVRFLLTPAHAE